MVAGGLGGGEGPAGEAGLTFLVSWVPQVVPTWSNELQISQAIFRPEIPTCEVLEFFKFLMATYRVPAEPLAVNPLALVGQVV